MEEKNMKAAMNVYESICAMFDDMDFKYTKHEEDLVITCTVRGDDFPMENIIVVHADRQIVQFISPMPFHTAEDKRVDMALAVAVANYGLVNGSFDYDLSDGEIRFRITQSYMDSLLDKEVFRYMLLASSSTIDKYNDRFFMLNKGLMTLEQFIEIESQNNE